MFSNSGPLREVMRYIWQDGKNRFLLDALAYWDGSIVVIDGKRYIDVNPEFHDYSEPDIELLSCGHQQPVRTYGKRSPRKTYNRRRRCIQCAMEATFGNA